MQRTIGFWKNHASCAGSRGNQSFILDETLADSLLFNPVGGLPGFWEGDLFVDQCFEAVSLLNKSTITTGSKKSGRQMSSDPAFNAAAQHVAFQLIPSTTTCSSANLAADLIQDYLDQVNFTGAAWNFNWNTPTNSKIGANLNFLSTLLDHYNNDTLDGGYPSNGGIIDCNTDILPILPYPPPTTPLPPAGAHNSLPGPQ